MGSLCAGGVGVLAGGGRRRAGGKVGRASFTDLKT